MLEAVLGVFIAGLGLILSMSTPKPILLQDQKIGHLNIVEMTPTFRLFIK
jgi:hypothetical protein